MAGFTWECISNPCGSWCEVAEYIKRNPEITDERKEEIRLLAVQAAKDKRELSSGAFLLKMNEQPITFSTELLEAVIGSVVEAEMHHCNDPTRTSVEVNN